MNNIDEHMLAFKRPVILGIVFSMAAELFIFILWGLILYPAGSIVYHWFDIYDIEEGRIKQ